MVDGCICRARINIAQHAARIEGKTSTARRRVFRYSGRTTGGLLLLSFASYFCRRNSPTFYALSAVPTSRESTTSMTRGGGITQDNAIFIEREDGKRKIILDPVTFLNEPLRWSVEERRMTHVGLGRGKNRSQSPLARSVRTDPPMCFLSSFR